MNDLDIDCFIDNGPSRKLHAAAASHHADAAPPHTAPPASWPAASTIANGSHNPYRDAANADPGSPMSYTHDPYKEVSEEQILEAVSAKLASTDEKLKDAINRAQQFGDSDVIEIHKELNRIKHHYPEHASLVSSQTRDINYYCSHQRLDQYIKKIAREETIKGKMQKYALIMNNMSDSTARHSDYGSIFEGIQSKLTGELHNVVTRFHYPDTHFQESTFTDLHDTIVSLQSVRARLEPEFEAIVDSLVTNWTDKQDLRKYNKGPWVEKSGKFLASKMSAVADTGKVFSKAGDPYWILGSRLYHRPASRNNNLELDHDGDIVKIHVHQMSETQIEYYFSAKSILWNHIRNNLDREDPVKIICRARRDRANMVLVQDAINGAGIPVKTKQLPAGDQEMTLLMSQIRRMKM